MTPVWAKPVGGDCKILENSSETIAEDCKILENSSETIADFAVGFCCPIWQPFSPHLRSAKNVEARDYNKSPSSRIGDGWYQDVCW